LALAASDDRRVGLVAARGRADRLHAQNIGSAKAADSHAHVARATASPRSSCGCSRFALPPAQINVIVRYDRPGRDQETWIVGVNPATPTANVHHEQLFAW
jgi:hypothetical protein